MCNSIVNGRRRLLVGGAAMAGLTVAGLPAILRAQQAPAVQTASNVRPNAAWGLQIGDVRSDRAIVWSRSDKPARMFVHWSRHEDFRGAVELRGPYALPESDLTSRIDLTELPGDEEIFVKVVYEDLDSAKARSL